MEQQTMACKSISENFLDQFENNVEDETVYGGDVIKATDLLTLLSDCLNNTDNVFENENEEGFTEDIIKMCDEMINQTVSWNEIGKDDDRFTSSSNIFQTVDNAAFQLLESGFDQDFYYTHITVEGDSYSSIDEIEEELCKSFSAGKICVLRTVLTSIPGKISSKKIRKLKLRNSLFYILAVATQFSFNNSALSMLPEDSNSSMNKSLVPASKLIGLYIGSTRLEFPEDGSGAAPVRVYFHHDSLLSLHEVNIISFLSLIINTLF